MHHLYANASGPLWISYLWTDSDGCIYHLYTGTRRLHRLGRIIKSLHNRIISLKSWHKLHAQTRRLIHSATWRTVFQKTAMHGRENNLTGGIHNLHYRSFRVKSWMTDDIARLEVEMFGLDLSFVTICLNLGIGLVGHWPLSRPFWPHNLTS